MFSEPYCILCDVLPAMCLTNGFSALGSSRQLVGRECLFFDFCYFNFFLKSRPWAARLGQLCAAINKMGRGHRQAHHRPGAAQGREGRQADWQHEPGRSKGTSPAQAANRPDASRNRHHPTFSPTTPAFAARPISRLLLPMRKRASLPPVHAWLHSMAPEHV